MVTITLPDNSQRQYPRQISIMEVAQDIGAGLARATLAGKVDGLLVDTDYQITDDCELSLVTDNDPEGLDILRHSSAHLLAHAVKGLYPETQVTIGPVIADGFYYDFARATPFTPEDLDAIEARMRELVQQQLPVERYMMSRQQAIDFFQQQGENYKAEIIASIPEQQELSFYRQGEFTDLCRGPHVPNTGKLKVFKLTKLAGAYWRGDSNNQMLQRIYGTAWADKKSMRAYFTRLAEAEKRDHRKLGKKLDLFHFQPEAPGMVFWHAKGWTLYQRLVGYLREKMGAADYLEVSTPQMVDKSLWERSGHWDKFRQDMFTTHSENRDYAIKPMNCPCHVQIFNQGIKSYRDLPLRLAEFGSCHRNEASGTLHGLMRARHFTQDDGHIFCAEESIQDEVATFIDMLFAVYADFGFQDILVKLSTRPDNRVGDESSWDVAEQALELALDTQGLQWTLQPGEGAFYGPKIEFSLRDCLDRIWQCGTIQVDFSMPQRLGASYIAEDNSKQVPVMLHRAIVGSMERFIGILIEHYAGALPLWLAPVQVVVISITARQADYAVVVADILQAQGFLVDTDLRNETIGLKIREHAMQRVPYQLLVGDKEQQAQTVAVRDSRGKDWGGMPLTEFIDRLGAEIIKKIHVVED